MRRLAGFAVAVAVVASLSGNASASNIVLTTNTVVSPGVFRIDAFLALSTPSTDLLAIQFDLDLDATGQGSLAATPQFREPNSQRSSATETITSPFDLSDSIDDPANTIDVRVVHAATDVFNVTELLADAAAFPNCNGFACTLQALGLTLNAVYLGSFNMNIPRGVLVPGAGPDVFVGLPANSIFGEDDDQPQDGIDPLITDLRNSVSNNRVRIHGVVPEPAGLALMGLTLAALSAARRRS